MTKVLAAIDGSEHAMRALERAVGLFGESADYLLLSVVPPWSPAVAGFTDETVAVATGPAAVVMTHGTSTGTAPYAPQWESSAGSTEALRNYYLATLRRAAMRAGITAEHVVEEAEPQKRRIGRAICDSAQHHRADVIVIGSHGSSHTGEVLLGSVSQYVLHHTSCPVLVVRESG